MDILSGLNSEQQRAVLATEGPVLILAGAGSGKTKCLTHRLAYIINSKKAQMSEILVVTFTNKAAQEMARRILNVLDMPLSDFEKNPNFTMRRTLPWVGTFHSICVRLLRAEAINIGLRPQFTILDSDDSLSIIKSILKDKNLDPKQYSPQAIRSIISNAKNELMNAAQYKPYAQGHFQEVAAEVFSSYERKLGELQALDFDDLIARTVKMLEDYPEIRAKYNKQFKYVMVDEYQDTNRSQYKLTKMLTNPATNNLCVVGDDFQCVVKGTKICSGSKQVPIEQLKEGDAVLAASGFGSTNSFKITSTAVKNFSGTLVKITTKSGKSVTTTPEHIFFTKLKISPDLWFVYLMYRADKGYRVGITRGVRSGKAGKLKNGLQIRTNQEGADKIWILESAKTIGEARYLEEVISLKYQIPKVMFIAKGRGNLAIDERYIEKIFSEINTRMNAKKLFEDFCLSEDMPHHRPQAVTSVLTDIYPGRSLVHLVQFGESWGERYKQQIKKCMSHRIRITTANKEIIERLKGAGITLRSDKGSYKVETSRARIADAYALAKNLSTVAGVDLCCWARLGSEESNYSFQPASHLKPGMLVPVLSGDEVIAEEITQVDSVKYSGDVIDINVAEATNFVANGIVTHNSIYSWRGADFKNILNFNRDYTNTTVIKLEQNYRSTKTILAGASAIIEKVKHRSDKKIWTDNDSGVPITLFEAHNGYGEADFVATEARSLKSMTGSYKEMAILYRTNSQSRLFEEVFLSQGIPYRLIGALRFYERREIKDVLAYLRFLINPDDTYSLSRIINTPPRGIGPKTFEKGGAKVDAFIAQMTTLRSALGGSPVTVLEMLLSRVDFRRYLDDGTEEGEARWQNVEELINLASEFEKMEDFLEHVALVSDVDNYDGNSEAVTLMTIHAAKGLEFDTVFLVGMEEGLFPHLRALDNETEMDEERRLCYVGMTRARKRLYLTNARSRIIHGGLTSSLPSRFIREIDSKLVDRV